MYSSRYQGIIYFLSQLSLLSENLSENTAKVYMIHLNVGITHSTLHMTVGHLRRRRRRHVLQQ